MRWGHHTPHRTYAGLIWQVRGLQGPSIRQVPSDCECLFYRLSLVAECPGLGGQWLASVLCLAGSWPSTF